MDRENSSTAPLKNEAKALRKYLAEQGVEFGHSKCLEAVARMHGFKNWDTASAQFEVSSMAPLPPFSSVKEAIAEGGRWAEYALRVHGTLNRTIGWMREARGIAQALRAEAGWEKTWPLPWEAVGGEKEITVNGRKIVTTQNALSYEDVLLLAYPGIDTARVLSVTVRYGDGRGKILTRGESVRIEPKMVVNAYDTSNA